MKHCLSILLFIFVSVSLAQPEAQAQTATRVATGKASVTPKSVPVRVSSSSFKLRAVKQPEVSRQFRPGPVQKPSRPDGYRPTRPPKPGHGYRPTRPPKPGHGYRPTRPPRPGHGFWVPQPPPRPFPGHRPRPPRPRPCWYNCGLPVYNSFEYREYIEENQGSQTPEVVMEPQRSFQSGGSFEPFDPGPDSRPVPGEPADPIPNSHDLQRYQRMMEAWQ